MEHAPECAGASVGRGADERDACGTGFVADRRGRRSHRVLRKMVSDDGTNTWTCSN